MSRRSRILSIATLVAAAWACAGALAGTPATAAAADSTSASRGTWAEARALADDGRYDESLKLIHRGLALDPNDIDLRWLEAGVTGWSGRHAEAVRLYEALVAEHPELAREVRTDLATERLWAGDPRAALRDLNVRLAEDPTDQVARVTRALALSHADQLRESLAAYDSLIAESPDDVDLQLQRARVLTWMGRSAEAKREYRDILVRDPGNASAVLGLARVENWSGQHRRAIARLEPLASDPQADPEVLKTLGFAHYWSGDPALGRKWTGAYLAREPHGAEGRELLRQIDRERSPSLTLGYARSDDSDGLRVGTTTMELGVPLGARNRAALGWQRDNVRDPGGTIDPLQLVAGLETIWSATWRTHARLNRVDFGDDAGTAGHGELAVTWRPEDRTRIDAGVSRDLIMTRISLALGISAQTWVLGFDFSPVERLTLHADARQRFYSDENRSQAEALSVKGQVYSDRTRKLALLVRGEQLRTRFDLDHGYYDPEQYLEGGPGAEAEWTPRPDVSISGRGWTGWQRERGAETEPFVNASGRVEWRIDRIATFAIEGGRSNSNLQTASGYERKYWAVSVTRGF